MPLDTPWDIDGYCSTTVRVQNRFIQSIPLTHSLQNSYLRRRDMLTAWNVPSKLRLKPTQIKQYFSTWKSCNKKHFTVIRKKYISKIPYWKYPSHHCLLFISNAKTYTTLVHPLYITISINWYDNPLRQLWSWPKCMSHDGNISSAEEANNYWFNIQVLAQLS